MQKEKDEVLWENEISANKLMSVTLLVLSGVFVSRHYNYDKPWLKAVMMADLLFAIGFFDIVCTFYLNIMIAVPIIISSRYFSKKYTRNIVFISFLVFLYLQYWEYFTEFILMQTNIMLTSDVLINIDRQITCKGIA